MRTYLIISAISIACAFNSGCALRPIQDCKTVNTGGKMIRTLTGEIKLIPGETRLVCNAISPKKDQEDYFGTSYLTNWRVEK